MVRVGRDLKDHLVPPPRNPARLLKELLYIAVF